MRKSQQSRGGVRAQRRAQSGARLHPSRLKGHTASCVWRGPAAARGFISPVPRSDDLAQPCVPGDGRQQKPSRSTQDIAVVESDAEEPTERVCRVACSRHMDDQPEFRGRCPSRHRENDRAEGEVDAQKVPGPAEVSPLKVSALRGRRQPEEGERPRKSKRRQRRRDRASEPGRLAKTAVKPGCNDRENACDEQRRTHLSARYPRRRYGSRLPLLLPSATSGVPALYAVARQRFGDERAERRACRLVRARTRVEPATVCLPTTATPVTTPSQPIARSVARGFLKVRRHVRWARMGPKRGQRRYNAGHQPTSAVV